MFHTRVSLLVHKKVVGASRARFVFCFAAARIQKIEGTLPHIPPLKIARQAGLRIYASDFRVSLLSPRYMIIVSVLYRGVSEKKRLQIDLLCRCEKKTTSVPSLQVTTPRA